MRPFFVELKEYVRFVEEDERVLQALGPQLSPIFPAVVEDFYERIHAHPPAAAVLTGGEAQIARLKGSLVDFLQTFFAGPWDAAYFDKRARIGRRHVKVGLAQHYMVTALSAIRAHLCQAVLCAESLHGVTRAQGTAAINKLCDIELAVMLHTFREDTLRKLQASERLATFGEMTSAICHELRNPLGVIESSSFMLRRREDDAYKIKHLERIERQVRRSTRIITNMLDIVRESPVSVRSVPVGSLCGQARQSLQEETGVTVDLDLPEDLPPVMVDPGLALQILGNLLHNAVEASPESGARIRLSARTDGDAVLFVVEDNGAGVPEHVRQRLFEPLVTTKEAGIGLGLTLSRKLAAQLRGTLELLTSEPGGASFGLRLPASDSR